MSPAGKLRYFCLLSNLFSLQMNQPAPFYHFFYSFIKLPLVILLLVIGCTPKEEDMLFTLLSPSVTHVDFRNDLRFDQDFNIFTYRNYYNGGGVALGDINNDGLVDIYFTANLEPNKLYLNKGNFEFEDISNTALVAGTKAWSTGVAMVDINGDGFLDIYVCNSGDIKGDNKQNELFINNGDLTFTEKSAEYGLDDAGYSTHATFFDYDKDGDLDAYILNNSYEAIGSFDLRRNERPNRDEKGGDKLMRNDNGHFVDVSAQSGIYGSIIGFGLGVTVGDVNGDNWEDIYVSNDFFERDYLYINQKDGTFKEQLTEQIKSISIASMGADMVDLNHDGNNEIFVTEMLPSDPERMKTVANFETWDRHAYVVQTGYYEQYPRNVFQLNNGNGTFSEIGRMLGIEASDWSWGALFFDMNNDGERDLFIANGIYQDLTDQDYLQYISTEEVMRSFVKDGKPNYAKLVELIPSQPIPNQAYLNAGNLNFQRQESLLGLGQSGFSNGAAYGDLDNDGDLDLVVNNVNSEAWIYRNNLKSGHYVKVKLKGNGLNTFGIGAKVEVGNRSQRYFAENQPIRGFQSSMDPVLHFGFVDSLSLSIKVTWPSGLITELKQAAPDQTIVLEEPEVRTFLDSDSEISGQSIFQEAKSSPVFVHQENSFSDFDRDRLVYHKLSTEGPKMSSGELNGDGINDVFIGGSSGYSGTLFMSKGDGFEIITPDTFEKDKGSEDAASIFFDADGDGDLDLYVCSGGVEFSPRSKAFADRLYVNQGNGEFTKSEQELPFQNGYVSTSAVAAADIDLDGDIDIFVGEGSQPFQFGIKGNGYVLINDGKGAFKALTSVLFKKIGMITDADFADLNGDGYPELVVVGEYMGVSVFKNEKGSFVPAASNLSSKSGWWKSLKIVDLNDDGLPEIIAGNHGLNSRFHASDQQPIKLYVGDFDANGYPDPIMTVTNSKGEDVPVALRHTLIDQIKPMKKKFPDYAAYQNATIDVILSKEEQSKAEISQVTELRSMIFYNLSELQFDAVALPVLAQISPVYAIECADFDQDGKPEIILGGNLYGAKPEVGRYDASYGTYLKQDETGRYEVVPVQKSGLNIDGEIRDFLLINHQLWISRNSDSLKVYTYQ